MAKLSTPHIQRCRNQDQACNDVTEMHGFDSIQEGQRLEHVHSMISGQPGHMTGPHPFEFQSFQRWWVGKLKLGKIEGPLGSDHQPSGSEYFIILENTNGWVDRLIGSSFVSILIGNYAGVINEFFLSLLEGAFDD